MVPVAALVVAIVVQVIVGVAIVVFAAASGAMPNPDQIATMLETPAGLIASIVGTQVCFAAVTVVAAMLSPEGFRERVGWVRPVTQRGGAFPAWAWVAVAMGAWIPAMVGLGLARLVPWSVMPSGQVERLWATLPVGQAAAFVVMIALLPGVIEETLFRGYMQRRLLKRWSARAAIVAASAAFALAHMDPQTVVFAFPIGLWLGYVAQRCGSTLPCIAAHAFINGSWTIYQMLGHRGMIGEDVQMGVAVGMVVAAGVGMVGVMRLLRGGWELRGDE